MRLDSHGVAGPVWSLLPVPRLDYSADELFCCDEYKTFDKLLALEILSIHVCDLEARVDVAEEIDITFPSSLAEKFIGQLIPRAAPSCVVNDDRVSNSPLKACTWFEEMDINHLSAVREIEAYMPDLPDACYQFNKSLNEDILQAHLNFVKEHECLIPKISDKSQVCYEIESGPSAIPHTGDGGHKRRCSVQQTLVDDAPANLKIEESKHHTSLEAFLPWGKNSPLEQNFGPSLQNPRTFDFQNLVGPVGTEEVELTELLDFDPADFLLKKVGIGENIAQHNIQAASSPSCAVVCLSLLDDTSGATKEWSAPKDAAMKTIPFSFELPEVLQDEYFNGYSDLKLGSYVSGSLIKPNPMELEQLDPSPPDFQVLVVLPELTLQTPSFHFLHVPTSMAEHQARIAEDVFKALFQEKALPNPGSASDWLYLDWHLSQVGHCNNYGCFQLQKRLLENELRAPFQRDKLSGKRLPDLQLLLGLAEEFLPWHHAETESGYDINESPAAEVPASISTSMPNFSNFMYTADKAEEKNCSDQSVLTDEPRLPVKQQVPLAGFDPTSMDTDLSFMKQARQGLLSREAELIQASGNDSYQQARQNITNTKSQPRDLPAEKIQILETAPTPEKIQRPKPSYISGVEAASSYLNQTSNYGGSELIEPLVSSEFPSEELLQRGFSSAAPGQPPLNESIPHQLELDNLTQFSNRQEPHLIVVANILEPDGSILLQRRSSYQKILGLENEDLQVVERALMLPVDLILNPSTCLTIYTEERLLERTSIRSPNHEGFVSCVMDTIVECHMRALSFPFGRWFMIFEGEMAFTSAITNILHTLHNSSAAFEMSVQIFISTDAMSTDSLILKCIKKMWKMSKRPFDCPMSEDLTDGEICLATFPSLNPLSSHAILCLGVPIATFLSWPLEQQVSALQGFDVRSESLHLLKDRVPYGKLEASAHPNNSSQHTWPSAAEILAHEVIESHVKDALPYFPPASEITNCELEVEDARESDDMPTNERQDDLSLPDYLDPDFQAGRGVFAYQGVPNAVRWSNDGYQSFKLPHDACVHTERPESLEDYSSHCNPNDVQSILQQWIRRRKGDAKDLKQSVTDSELFCDSIEILNSESYHARPCKNKSPPSAAFTADAVYPGFHSTYRCEATDEHRWAPVVRASDQRKISALDQFRFKKRVSPAARSHNKKLKPAAPSTRTKDDGPSAQLEHSLKISRNSCYKFNPPGHWPLDLRNIT